MFKFLRRTLMKHAILEASAGEDTAINPQHSRASRKQFKDVAELLVKLSDDSTQGGNVE